MSRQIATFTVGGAKLGLDILVVKEVHRHEDLTPIPGAPDYFVGLMNLRGRVVTVIDLAVTLGQDAVDPSAGDRKLLILKTKSEIARFQQRGQFTDLEIGNDIVGFSIDTMGDVLEIEGDDVLPTPPNLEHVDRQLIEGVIKLKNQLVLILSLNNVFRRITDAETT